MHGISDSHIPSTALWFVVNLEDLLHLVNAAMDGTVQDTRYHQTLDLLGINVQLLHIQLVTTHTYMCLTGSHTSNFNMHSLDSGLEGGRY